MSGWLGGWLIARFLAKKCSRRVYSRTCALPASTCQRHKPAEACPGLPEPPLARPDLPSPEARPVLACPGLLQPALARLNLSATRPQCARPRWCLSGVSWPVDHLPRGSDAPSLLRSYRPWLGRKVGGWLAGWLVQAGRWACGSVGGTENNVIM